MRWLAGFVLLTSACGGPAGGSGEPMKIEVPPQPPQSAPIAAALPDASAPIAAARTFSCKGDGIEFSVKDRSLCAYPAPATWENAEAKCFAEGGHLLAFETEDDSKAAQRAIGSHLHRPDVGRAAWVGLEIADKKKRTWKWGDGEAVKPTSTATWNRDEPNNWDGNELCGEWLVANGRWNDTRCSLQQPYLCEPKAGAPLACTTSRITREKGVPEKDYCWVPTQASYADAKKGCAKIGGTLAMPKADEDEVALMHGFGNGFQVTEFWVGLNDLATEGGYEGTWLWTTGASSQSFWNWKPEEPNGYRGNEHCVEVFQDSWQWNDLDCTEQLPFVCQAPAHEPL